MAPIIGNDRQGTNAHTTKGSRPWGVTVQHMNECRITMTLHHHLVVPQLLGNIASRCTRYFNPCFREERTGSQNENEVKDGVEGIVDDFGKGGRWRDVVRDSSDGIMDEDPSTSCHFPKRRTRMLVGARL
jgi:hypothetical protein